MTDLSCSDSRPAPQQKWLSPEVCWHALTCSDWYSDPKIEKGIGNTLKDQAEYSEGSGHLSGAEGETVRKTGLCLEGAGFEQLGPGELTLSSPSVKTVSPRG